MTKIKVKVFTSGLDPDVAGDNLTIRCNKFLEEVKGHLVGIHSNSNEFGWMLVISYEVEVKDE